MSATDIHAVWMRCPFCQGRFPLTEQQRDGNHTFTCPICHKRNQGSWNAEPDGTLIGRKAGEHP